MTTTTNPEPSRSFTGLWLPRDILETDLSWLQRLLWAEVYALYCEDRGGCFASNAYLAKVLGTAEGTIANAISDLRERGWIRDIEFNGRSRLIRAVYAPYAPRAAVSTPPARRKASGVKPDAVEAALKLEAMAPEPPEPADVIYQAYPRKVGKPDALRKIRAALKLMPFDELLKRVQAYARSRDGREVQFTPHPATWFSQHRYNDHENDPTPTQGNLWD